MAEAGNPLRKAKNALPVLGGGVREKDPVCGMTVDPEKAAATFEFDGKNYQFCSKRCAERFAATPEKFLVTPGTAGMELAHGVTNAEPLARDRGVIEAGPAAKLAKYTCPMHPEIVQIGPGSCPICGMALEPIEVRAEAEADPEYESMSRRLVDQRRAVCSTAGNCHGRAFAADSLGGRHAQLDRTGAGNSCCVVGRVAIFRALLDFAGAAQPEHVHADRAGNRRGVSR